MCVCVRDTPSPQLLDTVPGTDKYLRKCVATWALFVPFMKVRRPSLFLATTVAIASDPPSHLCVPLAVHQYHLRVTQQQQQLLARIEREAVNMGYTYKYMPMDEDEDEEEDELSSEDAHS